MAIEGGAVVSTAHARGPAQQCDVAVQPHVKVVDVIGMDDEFGRADKGQEGGAVADLAALANVAKVRRHIGGDCRHVLALAHNGRVGLHWDRDGRTSWQARAERQRSGENMV
ncbi:MAG: hypothetical protein V4633_08775 [Pseudomonadota bacterium]